MAMHQLTPFVPCTDLQQQVTFYEKVLGFTVGLQVDYYAFLRCDQVALRLVQVSEDVDLHHPERQNSFYIDVDDVDALYQTLKPRLDELPAGRVRAPFDQDYGQRELHVIDEDCTLIYFGHPLPKSD